jgi:hypothetical protein
MRQQVDELPEMGIRGQEKLQGKLLRLGAQLVVQEALEREATERLGRAHYQHREPGEPLQVSAMATKPGDCRQRRRRSRLKCPRYETG